MTFAELVEPLKLVEEHGNLRVEVNRLTDDSRFVKQGSVFVAVKGGRVDGHAFIGNAITAGASALVVQDRGAPELGAIAASGRAVPTVRVEDSRRALGLLASRLSHEPSSRLSLVGVTGTNGKTTVTYLCKAILEAGGRRVGIIGTVGYQIGSEWLAASYTTPGAVELQALLARMVDAG
ncbi:MAG: UDP-N-acetylmuramoyl-L-alanyl-D-glutamate--2,6-diaminopimelate ligase, partial [Nitrospira sp.]|nr:UDP-N-acetylmuramoyl-L-alanyl-D-glutamate--2,6-diaminopimelate ligase [Nitrospira sp.]